MRNIDLKNVYQWPLKQQLVLFIFIFIIVFYAGYYFVLSGQKEKLANLKVQEEDLKSQLQMAINKEKKLEVEIAQHSNINKVLAAWKAKLINYSGLPTLMNEILKIGAANNIIFSLFKPKDEVKVDAYVKVPIEVIAVGSYHRLGDFISQVSNMKNIVVISSLLFTNENKADALGSKLADQANAQNLLTALITLDIYMEPEAKK